MLTHCVRNAYDMGGVWRSMFLTMTEQWNQAHSGIVFYVAVIALIAMFSPAGS